VANAGKNFWGVLKKFKVGIHKYHIS